jgi:hypothetical protein
MFAGFRCVTCLRAFACELWHDVRRSATSSITGISRDNFFSERPSAVQLRLGGIHRRVGVDEDGGGGVKGVLGQRGGGYVFELHRGPSRDTATEAFRLVIRGC